MSETCSSTALDFRSILPRETSIVDFQKLTVDCGLSLPKPIDNVTLKFELPQSRFPVDFYQVELELSFQLVGDDLKVTEDTLVAPVCGGLSVIDKLEVWCAGRPVRTYDSYNYLNHLMTILKTDKSWFPTLGEAAAFYPDDSQSDGDAVYKSNGGAGKRRTISAKGKIYNTISRLYIPILTQQRFVPCDQANNWQIQLHLVDSNFMILKEPTLEKNYKLLLHKAKLHLAKCQLSQLASGYLESSTALSYPVTDYVNQTYTFYSGTQVRTTPTCSLETWPKRVFFAFLDQDAAENQQKNSFHYKHFDLESLQLSLGGKILSLDNLIWDREGSYDVVRAYYNTVYTSLGATSGFLYGISDFVTLAPIICFDCTFSGHSANCDIISTPKGPTGYNVTVKFKKALTSPVIMRVICEYDTLMSIENSGIVTFG